MQALNKIDSVLLDLVVQVAQPGSRNESSTKPNSAANIVEELQQLKIA